MASRTRTYRVTWSIDVEERSALAAAQEALRIHRDPTSIATVFRVRGHGKRRGRVIDLGSTRRTRSEPSGQSSGSSQSYIVGVQEVWTQDHAIEARSRREAIERVAYGYGRLVEGTLEFSHTLDTSGWSVEQVRQSGKEREVSA